MESVPVIVVLNDNGRSYDPTAGRALAAHLKNFVGGTRGPNLFETWDLPPSVRSMGTTSRHVRYHEAAAAARPVVVHAVT